MAVLVGVSYLRVSYFCYLNLTCDYYQVPKALKNAYRPLTVIQNGTQDSKEEAISYNSKAEENTKSYQIQ